MFDFNLLILILKNTILKIDKASCVITENQLANFLLILTKTYNLKYNL